MSNSFIPVTFSGDILFQFLSFSPFVGEGLPEPHALEPAAVRATAPSGGSSGGRKRHSGQVRVARSCPAAGAPGSGPSFGTVEPVAGQGGPGVAAGPKAPPQGPGFQTGTHPGGVRRTLGQSLASARRG